MAFSEPPEGGLDLVTNRRLRTPPGRTGCLARCVLHKAIVIIYSQYAHQPSGTRRFGFEVSLASPLRPILHNGNPLRKFLGNAFTDKCILQRPIPRHLWAAENALPKLPAIAVMPGSWAYEKRGQPNEESDCDSSCFCRLDLLVGVFFNMRTIIKHLSKKLPMCT